MPPLNDTTRVSVDKTVSDVQKCLATYGAKAILSEYDADGDVITLSFEVSMGQRQPAFRMPSDSLV